jgi:AcrR family transcriptional regulator
MTRKVRDAERTRAELIDVATQIFAEHGFAGARVDVIAEQTRTTKRMIYYYFGGKEQLYMAVLEHAYRGFRSVEDSVELDKLEPVDAIRTLAERTFDHHLEHPEFVRLVSIENIHRGEYVRRLASLREFSQPAADAIQKVLARGVEEGVFRKDIGPVDVHMLISAYCVFQVANRHTFGQLFDVDFDDLDERRRMRSTLGDIVTRWILVPE